MRDLAWRVLFFVAERIRMIFLALAFLAASKALGGALLERFDPQPKEPEAMAQP
jgi:hypothetical protein